MKSVVMKVLLITVSRTTFVLFQVVNVHCYTKIKTLRTEFVLLYIGLIPLIKSLSRQRAQIMVLLVCHTSGKGMSNSCFIIITIAWDITPQHNVLHKTG